MQKEHSELREVLELLDAPAILDGDGVAEWCNHAARLHLFSEGDELSRKISGYSEAMRTWDGRKELQVSVTCGDRLWEMTAKLLEKQTLLILKPEEKPELQQSVLDSVLRGIGPGVELLLGSLRKLIPELEDMESEKLQTMTSEIIRAGYCLKRSVHAYENLGLLQGDTVRLEKHSVRMHDFISGLLQKEADILRECKIRLVQELDMKPYAAGYMDTAAVEQIVASLLSNAVKFGDRAKPVEISVSMKESMLILRVRNYGKPMENDTLSAAFSQYSQDPLSGNQQRGTGIGLAVVRALARQHGGSAVIETEPDGTVVTVSVNVGLSNCQTPELHSPRWKLPSSAADLSLIEFSPLLPNETFDSRNIEL